jgi:hypothetical protein
VVKSDKKVRAKQVDILQTLKDFVDPISEQSIGDSFKAVFKALTNLLDGSMPVINEYGTPTSQDEDVSGDPYSTASSRGYGMEGTSDSSVSQFTVYIEKIIEQTGKLDESVP